MTKKHPLKGSDFPGGLERTGSAPTGDLPQVTLEFHQSSTPRYGLENNLLNAMLLLKRNSKTPGEEGD